MDMAQGLFLVPEWGAKRMTQSLARSSKARPAETSDPLAQILCGSIMIDLPVETQARRDRPEKVAGPVRDSLGLPCKIGVANRHM
jgi:hypothetical protein